MQLAKQANVQRLCSWAQYHKAETQTIVWLAIPVSASFLVNKALSLVSIIFVGHLGPADLAAASLGSSLSNVIGNSVLAGLAGAMSTLCGQVQYYCHPLLVITGCVIHSYGILPVHYSLDMNTHRSFGLLHGALIVAAPLCCGCAAQLNPSQPDCVRHPVQCDWAEVCASVWRRTGLARLLLPPQISAACRTHV